MEENKPENNQWRPVQIQTILVPTDLRLESMVAFQYALTLAKLFDANLTLLHVFEESYSFDREIGLRAVELLGVKKTTPSANSLSSRGIYAPNTQSAEAASGLELPSSRSCGKPKTSVRI
jgi:nucleotide-binding universal stress UspA family protein